MFPDGGAQQEATVLCALGGPFPPPALGGRRLLGHPGLTKKGDQEKGKLSGPRAPNQSRGSVVSLL